MVREVRTRKKVSLVYLSCPKNLLLLLSTPDLTGRKTDGIKPVLIGTGTVGTRIMIGTEIEGAAEIGTDIETTGDGGTETETTTEVTETATETATTVMTEMTIATEDQHTKAGRCTVVL